MNAMNMWYATLNSSNIRQDRIVRDATNNEGISDGKIT
jgi:hypothetical protein